MNVSVVIPVFNGRQFLAANLSAVIALKADEVIIVDDASTDGSPDYVVRYYPQVHLIRQAKNSGFPATVNLGFSVAKGDIVILINQDVKPDKQLVKYILPHFQDPHLFAVTFNEQARSWAKGGWVNGLLEFENGVLDNQVHLSLWPSGGGSAFRKSLWDQLGGFDDIFTPGYYEDLDIGLRAQKSGYKVIWDPKCRVKHATETSFNKAFHPKMLLYIKERNFLIVNWKHLPLGMFRAHLHSLISRTLSGPGFIVPLTLAVIKLPRIAWKKLAS